MFAQYGVGLTTKKFMNDILQLMHPEHIKKLKCYLNEINSLTEDEMNINEMHISDHNSASVSNGKPQSGAGWENCTFSSK